MEDLASVRASLEKLRQETQVLIEAAMPLRRSFAAEAERLRREDVVGRLMVFRSTILQELRWASISEDDARRAHTARSWGSSLVGLGAEAVALATTKNTELSKCTGYLVDEYARPECSFGTVMVCVGPKGLPDGVEVVPMSEIARELGRSESEVIPALRKAGLLLFSQEAFSSLVSKLTIGIREGSLNLPISRAQIASISLRG